MQTSLVRLAALSLGLLSQNVAATRGCQNPEEALEWFNYGVPVPLKCAAQMRAEAMDFCRGFLELQPVTSYLSTVTPEAPTPLTVTETSTTMTTTTEGVTTTLPVTSYTTRTGATTSTLTTSTTIYDQIIFGKRNYDGPAPVCALNPAACLNLATDCVPLTAPNLRRRRPLTRLDDYCRCLRIPLETVTADVSTVTLPTSTSTQVAVETDIILQTTIETVLDVSLITETTYSTTETQTKIQTMYPP